MRIMYDANEHPYLAPLFMLKFWLGLPFRFTVTVGLLKSNLTHFMTFCSNAKYFYYMK